MTVVIHDDQPVGTVSGISFDTQKLSAPHEMYINKQLKAQRVYQELVVKRKGYPKNYQSAPSKSLKDWGKTTYNKASTQFARTVAALKTTDNPVVETLAQRFIRKENSINKESAALTKLIQLLKTIVTEKTSHVQEWQKDLEPFTTHKELPEKAKEIAREVRASLNYKEYSVALIEYVQIKLVLMQLRKFEKGHQLRCETDQMLSQRGWKDRKTAIANEIGHLKKQNTWLERASKAKNPQRMLKRLATQANLTLRGDQARKEVKGVVQDGQQRDRDLKRKKKKLAGKVQGSSNDSHPITNGEIANLTTANSDRIKKLKKRQTRYTALATKFKAPKNKPQDWKKVISLFPHLYNELMIEVVAKKKEVLGKAITWLNQPANEKSFATVRTQSRTLKKRPTMRSLLAMHTPKMKTLTKAEVNQIAQSLIAASEEETTEPIFSDKELTKEDTETRLAAELDQKMQQFAQAENERIKNAAPAKKPQDKKPESWSPPMWTIVGSVALVALGAAVYWKRAQLRELVSTLRARIGRG